MGPSVPAEKIRSDSGSTRSLRRRSTTSSNPETVIITDQPVVRAAAMLRFLEGQVVMDPGLTYHLSFIGWLPQSQKRIEQMHGFHDLCA